VTEGYPAARAEPLRAWALRHFVAMTAVLGLAAYVSIYAFHLTDAPIRSDGYSYYVYLPAWFLYGDPTLAAVADECCGGTFPEFTGIRRWPGTGRWVDPHPIGVAIQMGPFFAVAHLLTRWSNLPPDGFSLHYQFFAGLSGLTALLAGLAILRGLLSRYYSRGVVLATLVTVTWGANAFHYGVYDATFSHAFSFFLIAALLALTDRWWTRPSWRASLGLAVVSALIVLTRHTNAIFLMILPLYGVTTRDELRANMIELWRRRALVAAMLTIAVVLVAPQLAIYKDATGQWMVSSYEGLGGFTFASPHLWGVLFSVKKGLFFWSPALLMAVAGTVVSTGMARRFRLAAVMVFLLNTYLIASWFDWQFGGSFGHRAFTDSLAIAAVFLAAFYNWTSTRPRVVPVVATVATICVALSIAQMLQYWLRILPIGDTTWNQYRDLFLRFR
jgi:hypothetical protein